jgi:uncharacterized damage-inducible protein DinB
MIDIDDIRELYLYNRWANARTLDAAASLAPEAFVHDLGSSYPSLRDTLVHIMWAEWIWLQRWQGTSPRIVFDPREFPTFNALNARWKELDAEQRAFVDAVRGDALISVVSYTNLQGERWEYELWRQMYHVVNHSSYHRGQVAAMLRQLGATPVSTDFLVYRDELQSTSKSRV